MVDVFHDKYVEKSLEFFQLNGIENIPAFFNTPSCHGHPTWIKAGNVAATSEAIQFSPSSRDSSTIC